MRYLVNGTLGGGRSREEFVSKISGRSLSDEAWDLVRRGVITEHGYKLGQRPGFVFVMEGDSAQAVRATIATLPLVREGWFEVEVDPISRFFSDLREGATG